MNEGFIILHKKLLQWEWYSDLKVKTLFIHCLLKANYTEKKWQGMEIKRGQFFTSIINLSNDLNLSQKQIRNCLKKLEKTNEIIKKGANKGTMITVCNYDTYQTLGQTLGQTKGKQRANKGQTKGKQRATTNKEKRIIIKKNKEEEKPKNQKIDFSDFSKELIELSQRVIKLFPASVVSTLTTKQKYEWIDTLRKLNEIDKLSLLEIEKIIKFARKSEFWSKNFLSVLKLRKKNKEKIKYYVVFQEQMKSEQKKNIGRITEDSVCQNTELYPDRMKWGHRK